ncbi:MAG: glycerol kinase GlpK [Bacteroidota bacterium]|nr:glycerol kinase GlpK [Bacteroidota bacterium]
MQINQKKYILAFDQGTTSSRALVINKKGEIISIAQKEFEQIFPESGWVEHDPNEIWASQASVGAEAISKIGINGKNIAAIGITNQRETTVVWDRNTGEPVYNAIVWQDRRTAKYCDELKTAGKSDLFKNKTGLLLDAYFSGTKLKWILDNVKGARKKAENGELAFGTVDSWLVWKLTQGEKHITDISNASRTLLYNIHDKKWDKELLQLFDIPESILPKVTGSSGILGETKTTIFAHPIPITGIAGDQQAALFGQQCTQEGMVKNTYGTGCFMLMNTGNKIVESKNNLLSTVAWQIDDEVTYALEGSVFIAGAVIQWLRDGLGIINSASEIEELALQVKDNGGVYFVPALTGLGAPHWDQYARGTITGLTRGTSKAHIARAALEGIAFQTADLLKAMRADSGIDISELRVDGGAAVNNLLLQFQSDVLRTSVLRPVQLETTALGAAYLAGLGVGYWDTLSDLKENIDTDQVFKPKMDRSAVEKLTSEWNNALEKAKGGVLS